MRSTATVLTLLILSACPQVFSREPIPDRLVVLTFDDAVKSHHTVARPLLKRYGFDASFFITEGFTFATNKRDYLTWEEIRELHQDGFEIGNHTRSHLGVNAGNVARLEEELSGIDERCREHGIPRPTSFAWPGNSIAVEALEILRRHGIRFARRGGAPEHRYQEGRGFAYEPGLDHPLLVPSAGDARPDWTLADFKAAVDQARDGRIAVIQFHGVPEGEHPWVHTPRERFEEYLAHLHQGGFKVIALRDLERYVDPERLPEDPWEVTRLRRDLLEFTAAGGAGSAVTLYDVVGRGRRGTRSHWGFATYLRFGKETILFDTGNDPAQGEGEPPAAGPPFFTGNARRLGADLAAVDWAVISHRHQDHAGGLKQFRSANDRARIYVPDPALLKELPAARLALVGESRELAPGQWLIRTVARDLDLPELSLALDTPRGILLVTGCCHPGLETIVQAAREFTRRPIHLLYGGFHLFSSPPEKVEALGRRLIEEYRVERVAPAHCSGWPQGGKTDTEAIFRKLWGPERFRYGRLEATLYFPGPAATKG